MTLKRVETGDTTMPGTRENQGLVDELSSNISSDFLVL